VKITPARARWFGRLGALVLRVVGSTWRIRSHGHVPAPPWRLILAFAHGDMLIPAVTFRRQPAAIMISHHGDGEVIAQVLVRMRKQPVRGSSTRGGTRAFLEMLRAHEALPWGVTPDGPRGPRGTVHEGVIQLAAESGRPIIPAGYAAARGRRLRSWDRFLIPAPFTRVVAVYGEPLAVPAGIDAQARAQLARELERRLAAAEREAEHRLQNARAGARSNRYNAAP
jgi:lysophospholipid acyltransferase (LPLAT)-like uncharacterized protein